MKNSLLKILSLAFLTIVALTFTSCDPEPCDKIECNEEHGICITDSCECDPGYGGSDCSILLSSAYIGNLNVVEFCDTYDNGNTSLEYMSVARVSPLGDEYFELTNLYDHFENPALTGEDTRVQIQVSENGLTLLDQEFPTIPDYRVSGTGTVLSGTSFTLEYTLIDTSLTLGNQVVDYCTGTYTFQ